MAVGLGGGAAPRRERLEHRRHRPAADPPADRVGARAFEHDQDDVALAAGDDRRRRRLRRGGAKAKSPP